MANKWILYLKKIKKENPKVKGLKALIKLAKKTYKK